MPDDVRADLVDAVLSGDTDTLDPVLDRLGVDQLHTIQDNLSWFDARLRRALHRHAGISTRHGEPRPPL